MYRVFLSTKKYKDKPLNMEIGSMSLDIQNNEYVFEDIEDLAMKLSKGHSVLLSNRRSASAPIDFQQFVMLDFDNKDENNIYSVADLKNDVFMQENACFYYRTFSDKGSNIDKFRVVFLLDKKVLINSEIETIYNKLFEKYPMSDTKIGQTNRIFFGGNNGYEIINKNNMLETFDYRIVATENEELGELITDDTPNYKLFKYKKYDVLQKRFGDTYSKIFDDNFSALSYFKSLDMVEVLGLPTEKTFLDIFHDESEPSANVYYSDEFNAYFYKCFSESKPFVGDITRVIGKYCGLNGFDSLNLLINVTNSEISLNSDLAKKKYEIQKFKKDLVSGELKKYSPELYQFTKKYSLEINATLDILLDSVHLDKDGNTSFVAYYSIDKLAKKVSTMTRGKISNGKMSTILNVIVVTEIIKKLPSNEIPPQLYTDIIEPQKNSEQIRVSNFYSPSNFEDILKLQMEEYANKLKENNITASSLGYEVIYRLFGEEKAKRDFPQAYEPLKEKGLIKMSKDDSNLTKKQIQFEKQASKIILKTLEDKGYILEDVLINKLSKKFKLSTMRVKDLYRRVRADIYSNYDLVSKRCTKELHTKLQISGKFSSKSVIFRESSLK